jgi:hypothetical protein
MQFQAPSVVQAPVCAPVTVPEPPVGVGGETTVVEVAAGAEEDDSAGADDAGAEDAGAEDDAGAEADVTRVVGAATPPVVRKTPPVGVLEDGEVSVDLVTGITVKISIVVGWAEDVANEVLLIMVGMLVVIYVVEGFERVAETLYENVVEILKKEEDTYIAGAVAEVAGS